MHPEQVCRIASEVLEVVAREPERPLPTPQLALTVLESLADEATRAGVDLSQSYSGAWHVRPGLRQVSRIGTGETATLGCGDFSMTVPSGYAPERMAALLNWCGADEPGSALRSDAAEIGRS